MKKLPNANKVRNQN